MPDLPQRPHGPTANELPERFGAYRVEALIGAGGMGVVYRAFDEALARPVALKTLLPALTADPGFVARFKREARSAAALNHPNITQIYTIGQEGAAPFFAMEWVDGRSLEAIVRAEGRIGPARAAEIIQQAAQGLRHAARKNLIHRDVKPSNLMLTRDGTVKITDFGLAKALRSKTQLTVTGEVLGSPGYISPEQAQGGEVDARSDIYSLGATFYHLVTGRLPFEAPTPVAMIIKHMNEPLRSPRAVNPSVPYPIATLIQRMMAKRPGDRFQDYDALLQELARTILAARSRSPAPTAGVAAGDPDAGGEAGSGAPTFRRPLPGERAAGAPAQTRRSASWLPVGLIVALGALIVGGLTRHGLSSHRATDGATAPEEAARPIEIEGAAVSVPGGGSIIQRGRGSLGRRLRERSRRRNRPNLTFVENDHEILPDGSIRVFGRVRNMGATTAGGARVRVRILRDNGLVAARGEAALSPSTIPPNGTATYSVPIEYRGPVGTIRAELRWLE
ncbi:MAG: protein kinase [Acidobacteriota bacterium]